VIKAEKRENFSLRKLRKPGEREKEKVVLLFSSTLLVIQVFRTCLNIAKAFRYLIEALQGPLATPETL
jgi:hypothetical protein